ncbi:MAG: hypothetical protein HY255_07820 [Betaproteobacteria bacterium]|nr:hypothetical protein [Betaproteobacteria bacterium]
MQPVRHIRTLLSLAALLLAGVAACGGGGGGASITTTPPDPTPVVNANADITLLFFGNSHTSVNNLSGMVGAMTRAALPARSVSWQESPDWMFLQERSTDAGSLALLKSHRWSAVILQAQAYSSSGQFVYPTDGAESLVRAVRVQGAVPVLFPEWPRRGINESQRITDTYTAIARNAPACVPPIPQAFDLAIQRFPNINLWNDDGNHSSPEGAFLAALILFNTITGLPINDLPSFAQFSVSASVQTSLRGVAAETVATFPTRSWCGGDPFVR